MRLLGIGVTALEQPQPLQGELFDGDMREKHGRLDELSDTIKKRFGTAAMRRAAELRAALVVADEVVAADADALDGTVRRFAPPGDRNAALALLHHHFFGVDGEGEPQIRERRELEKADGAESHGGH